MQRKKSTLLANTYKYKPHTHIIKVRTITGMISVGELKENF